MLTDAKVLRDKLQALVEEADTNAEAGAQSLLAWWLSEGPMYRKAVADAVDLLQP